MSSGASAKNETDTETLESLQQDPGQQQKTQVKTEARASEEADFLPQVLPENALQDAKDVAEHGRETVAAEATGATGVEAMANEEVESTGSSEVVTERKGRMMMTMTIIVVVVVVGVAAAAAAARMMMMMVMMLTIMATMTMMMMMAMNDDE